MSPMHQINCLSVGKHALTLAIISDNFPTVGETQVKPQTTLTSRPDSISASTCDSSLTADCSCPQRQIPPPPPPRITHNSVSTFWIITDPTHSIVNICDHQTLPLMSGPPMKLMVDPKTKPVAHYTHVPVPLHGQDDVKAHLDQNVRLSVLEPVSIDGPVTWCHRMVVCAKKKDTHCRAVFQAFKAHAKSKTHHTQSPFH